MLNKEKIKVLVVDDSAFMRQELRRILESDPKIEVIGIARNGKDAVNKITNLDPDVVTVDINMPVMDGLTMLKRVMMTNPKPCIMVSSLTQEGADATFEALELGAVDFVGKPSAKIGVSMENQKRIIIEKVKAAVNAKLGGKLKKKKIVTIKKQIEKKPFIDDKIIAIGVSTGGPRTLMEIIPNLPGDLNVGLLIIQHMPPKFTKSFAERLNQYSQLTVKEAENGEPIKSGFAYVAPGGYHMTAIKSKAKKGVSLKISNNPPGKINIPSVDVTFESLIDIYGSNIIAVILTGMGSDGAESIVKIRRIGGITIAEDESTCVVFGMPKVAIEKGGIEHILPVQDIPGKLINLLQNN